MSQLNLSNVSIRHEEVLAERVRILYQQSLPGAIVQCLSVIPTRFLLASSQQHPWYDLLTVAIVANGLATLACIITYRRHVPNAQNARKWGNYLVLFNLVAGSLWGLMLFAAFDVQSTSTRFLIVFLAIAIGVMAAPVLASYFAVYAAFCTPLVLTVAIRLLQENDKIFFILGWYIPAALPLLLYYAWRMSKTWTESLQLRFENIDLIAELTHQKNEAKAAQNSAEEANLSKSKFLAAASHDLRQPLHALSLFTATLASRLHDEKNRKIVENIQSSVSAMDALFNTLLDISKLDAGVVQAKKRAIPVSEVLRPLEKEFTVLAQQKGLEFHCNHDGVIAFTDPILLETILRNFLSNAVRYTSRGAVWLRCAGTDSKTIQLEVGDTGIGIPLDQQDAIFDEFYQLNNPERDRTKGLGLGLAIVKRITAMLDYDIKLVSTPGAGSRFILSIPLGEKQHIFHYPTNLPVTTTSVKALAVLVVDDDSLVRESMNALLQEWGYQVRAVESYPRALAILNDFTPNVIVADYQLPGEKTGVNVIEEVQKYLNKNIPSMIVTGDILPDHLREAEQSGLPVLHKPVAPAKIRAFLVRCQHDAIA